MKFFKNIRKWTYYSFKENSINDDKKNVRIHKKTGELQMLDYFGKWVNPFPKYSDLVRKTILENYKKQC